MIRPAVLAWWMVFEEHIFLSLESRSRDPGRRRALDKARHKAWEALTPEEKLAWLRGALLCLALACLAGCVDSVGPFVRSVTPNADGSLRVTSCDVELHRSIFISASLSEGECRTKVVRAP